jgi:hypothetical protein
MISKCYCIPSFTFLHVTRAYPNQFARLRALRVYRSDPLSGLVCLHRAICQACLNKSGQLAAVWEDRCGEWAGELEPSIAAIANWD